MKNGTKKMAIGAMIAAAAGYVAGILTAPKSGKETRKDIHQAAAKAKITAEHKLKELHSELSGLLDQAIANAQKVKAGAQKEWASAIANAQIAKEKVRQMLSALHEGDADDDDLKKAIDEANKAIKHIKSFATKDSASKAE